MIDAIIRFSVKNKLIAGILTLLLIAFSIYNYLKLPIDAVPDITNNQVQVVTISPSLAPQEVEQFTTFSVELCPYSGQNISVEVFKDKKDHGKISHIAVLIFDVINIKWPFLRHVETVRIALDQFKGSNNMRFLK